MKLKYINFSLSYVAHFVQLERRLRADPRCQNILQYQILHIEVVELGEM